MAEVKNKVITVESLKTLHTHNQGTYMTKVDPIGSGTLSMAGDGAFTGDVTTNSVTLGKAMLTYDATEGALKISFKA